MSGSAAKFSEIHLKGKVMAISKGNLELQFIVTTNITIIKTEIKFKKLEFQHLIGKQSLKVVADMLATPQMKS